MATFAKVIEPTDDISLVTDGERRYGNMLFDICNQVIRNGQVGRPKTTLKPWVKVRIKNKGSQSHQTRPKRPKYQAPQPEHPSTIQNLEDEQIHANHVETFNSVLRRKLSAYRRKTNTYAKDQRLLQIRLDAYWELYNLVRVQKTLKQVPAVALGVLQESLSISELFKIQLVSAS